MKKKVLTVFLILALVVTALSAKDSGFRVGAQLGWGFDWNKSVATANVLGTTTTSTTVYKNNGFAGSLTAEYNFDEFWGIRGTAGMMFAGKPSYKYSIGDNKSDYKEVSTDQKSGLTWDFALDAKYTVALSKKLNLSALAGAELMTGYIYKTGTEDFDKNTKNVAFGLNAAAELSYKVNKNVYLNAGVNGAWFFVNNAEILKSSEGAIQLGQTKLADATYKTKSFILRPYLGATYAF